MTKKWLVLISLLLSLLILAACNAGGEEEAAPEDTALEEETAAGDTEESPAAVDSGEVIELDFWTFWGSETRRPLVNHLVEEFNSSQDEIEVTHTYIPWGDIWTKNLASIAAGDPPDVIVNDIRTVANRAYNGQVENLTQFMDEELENKFYPYLWETVLYEGEPYALPFTTDVRVLYYNKDAFEAAGLDPNAPPETWEELKAYAEELTIEGEGGRYEQVGFYPLWGNFGAHDWMMSADNGVGLIEDGEVKINTPEKVAALQWIYDWRQELGEETIQTMQAEFGSEQQNPFIAGKVAMWIDRGTFYTQLEQFAGDMNWGVALIPSYTEETEHWSSSGGFVMEIPEGASHPEASMEFLNYLTSKEAQKFWAMENFENVANIEATQAAIDELEGKAQEVFETTMESLDHSYLATTPIEYPEYQNIVNPLIDDALRGAISVEEALEQAQEEVESIRRE